MAKLIQAVLAAYDAAGVPQVLNEGDTIEGEEITLTLDRHGRMGIFNDHNGRYEVDEMVGGRRDDVFLMVEVIDGPGGA